MKLTVKQKRFADEYIITGNATESYKRAGYACKSDGTAGVEGHRLLKNPKIAKYLEKRFEELDEVAIMRQKELMERLTKIGRREEKEHIVITVVEEQSEWVDGRKQSVRREVPKIVEIPAKLSDTNKALELIGKRYVMWTDKVDTSADLTIVFEDDYGEDADDS